MFAIAKDDTLSHRLVYCIKVRGKALILPSPKLGEIGEKYPLSGVIAFINADFKLLCFQEMIRNRTHMQQLTNKWYEEVRGRPSASEDEEETEI